jgi:spore coat protein A, manganese oxidase
VRPDRRRNLPPVAVLDRREHMETTMSRSIGRRGFLKVVGGAAGATVALGGGALSLVPSQAIGQGVAGAALKKFVDALPLPGVMAPSGLLDGAPVFDVTMRQIRQKLHKNLPSTTVWAYNGTYPGATFEVRSGQPIAVRWKNDLPSTHLLPLDPTLHGDEPPTPAVRTVVHLHGAKVLPESDGYPEAWFTNGFGQTGPFFETRTYHYPNDQPATNLWYHDHALGITRLNVYTGLAGFYFIRDAVEDSLNLPSGAYEIPLLIQDRMFNNDGSLFYPVQAPGADPDPRVPPVWIPEFFGDTVLVNGKVWPFLEVEPRKYRFRMLNGSNARFYHLTLNEADADGVANGRPGPAFHQIGTDGGLLPAPVTLTDLLIAPAERYDLVIDFSGADGKFFVLSNDANAPYPGGDPTIPVPPVVMLFKVTKPLAGRDRSSLPRTLASVPALNPATATKTRDLVLSELDSAGDNPIVGLINAEWSAPVTETPKAGSTEIWRIINTTGDAHPIHVHLVQFQILDRQPFDTNSYPASLLFTGPRVAPDPNERGAAKDMVKSFPGEVVRIIAKFDLPTGTPVRRGDKFRYVLHCHILEHEDNDMMRPYDVTG